MSDTSLQAPATASESIFTTISRLANQQGAINLGQGFPDFAPDEALTDRLAYHVKHSSNQYAPPAGLPILLSAIKAKVENCHGISLDVQQEINITSGATQAIWTTIQSVVRPGDEVIIFEPAYDSYAPAVESKGGVVVPCVLPAPAFRPDWSGFGESLSEKTRLVIINNPHNPTGTCWTDDDLQTLADHLAGTDILLLSDEVYEHLTYDGRVHNSVLRYPELRRRAFVTCSFGKTFHVTGWKVGYVIAPPELMRGFRGVHQFTVFTVNTPAQYALADHLADERTYLDLPMFFQRKRDLFEQACAKTPFKMLPSEGSYFGLLEYSALSNEDDLGFAERLVATHGIALIPISPFYTQPPTNQRYLRYCFAKQDLTLQHGAARLLKVGAVLNLQ